MPPWWMYLLLLGAFVAFLIDITYLRSGGTATFIYIGAVIVLGLGGAWLKDKLTP